MANWRGVGAFFDGFNQAYDTTNRVVQDAELSRISRATPEEISTPVETMQGFEGAAPDASGATSQMDLADAPMVQQKTGFRLLGQTYNQAPSESAIANARMRAMADAVSRNDPMAGMRLRQQVQQSERDDERFGMERQRFAREGQEGDLRLAGMRRADAQGQRVDAVQAARDRAARWTPEEVESFANKANVDGGVPLFHDGVDPKTGYSVLKLIDAKTGARTGAVSLSPTQMRQAALGAYLLDQGFGAEGMAELQGASKELAEHIMRNNSMVAQLTQANNSARHQGNQDATARITAGAAATNAATHRELIGEQVKDIKDARTRREDMAALESDYSQLSPVDQQGAKGQALLRRIQILNTKNGGGLQLGRDGSSTGGKKVQDLSRAEEISLGNAQKELANLPATATAGDIAKVYQKYGLDPARFGAQDPVKTLVDRLSGQGAGGSSLTPFTAADLAADRKAAQLDGYVKQPKRGLFAGRNEYEYVNPATGDRLTPQEYQRLDELRAQRDDVLRQRTAVSQ